MCSESPALLSRASAGILQVHWAGGCPVFLWVTRMGHEVPHTSGDPWPLRPAAASAPLCECGAPAALSPGPVGMCLRLLDVPMTSTVAHSPDDITLTGQRCQNPSDVTLGGGVLTGRPSPLSLPANGSPPLRPYPKV